jgi:hypothetical protein
MTTITQSTSQTVTTGTSVACTNTGFTTENHYYRAFNTSAFGIGPGDTYTITSVDVGIETANAGGPTQPLTVNLYTTSNFPTGFPGSATLIGTATVQVADQTLSVLNVPVAAVVPPGSAQIVYEVTTPDGVPGQNVFFIGANAAPETGPSYLSASACGALGNEHSWKLRSRDTHTDYDTNSDTYSNGNTNGDTYGQRNTDADVYTVDDH